jgi:hypothetical protein
VSALDVSVQAQVLELLAICAPKLGLSLLFISHDLSAVRHLCDRIVVLYLGRVMEEGADGARSTPRRAIPIRARCCRPCRAVARRARRARDSQGRPAEPGQSALGLRVPHALPACDGDLRARRAGAGRGRRRPSRGLRAGAAAIRALSARRTAPFRAAFRV